MTGKPTPLRERNAVWKIRTQPYCDRNCPAFSICPVMPLAIQPVEPKNRMCLVRDGPVEIRRVYRNLFVGGHSGIIEELQYCILEHEIILGETNENLTLKQKLQHLSARFKMLIALDRIIQRYGEVDDPADELVEIVTGGHGP